MKTFVLSDESLNSHGFWLPMSGAMLDQFKKNPVMLWMHQRAWRGDKDEVLPIGKWDNVRIEKGVLMADAVFDMNDEFAAKIADKVENGYIRMASLGIKVVETSRENKWIKPGQQYETPTKWEVREASIVDFGSNNNALALVLYDENDQLIELSASDAKQSFPLKRLDTEQSNLNNNMEKLREHLSLSQDATEDEVCQAVVGLKTKLSDAENRLAAIEKAARETRLAEANTLLDEAVRDGRIDAGSRAGWGTLFAADHEAAKASLLSIPRRSSLSNQLGKAAEADELDKMSWDQLDKSGKLAALKDKNPALFAAKFEDKFGKKLL